MNTRKITLPKLEDGQVGMFKSLVFGDISNVSRENFEISEILYSSNIIILTDLEQSLENADISALKNGTIDYQVTFADNQTLRLQREFHRPHRTSRMIAGNDKTTLYQTDDSNISTIIETDNYHEVFNTYVSESHENMSPLYQHVIGVLMQYQDLKKTPEGISSNFDLGSLMGITAKTKSDLNPRSRKSHINYRENTVIQPLEKITEPEIKLIVEYQ